MEGSNAATITTLPLPRGDRGVRATLANMQRLADDGSRDITVRSAIISVIHHAALGSHDFAGQAAAWFRFVRDQITFVNDPIDTEWLQSPRVTLAVGAGDCDDRATLLAAGLKSIGIPALFKVVAVDRRRPGEFSHVLVEALLNGRATALDPTYPRNLVGDEPRALRTLRVPAWRTAG